MTVLTLTEAVVLSGATVLLTFVTNLGSTFLVDTSKRKHETRQIALAILGEIKALSAIDERRGYRAYLAKLIDRLKTGDVQFLASARITLDYFLVFKGVVDKIGVLPGDLPFRIAQFYTQMSSILEDFNAISGGSWDKYQRSDKLSGLTHLLDLMNETSTLANDIVLEITAFTSNGVK